jgi:hypothetical protein
MHFAAGRKDIDRVCRNNPVSAVGLQDLANVGIGDLAAVFEDAAQLLEDFEAATDVLVVPLQAEFFTPQHDVDPQDFPHFSQVFVPGSKQSSDLILIGKRESRFGHAHLSL